MAILQKISQKSDKRICLNVKPTFKSCIVILYALKKIYNTKRHEHQRQYLFEQILQ